jgi:Tol biopolymer transport system component
LRIWSINWTADGSALFAAAQSSEYVIARIELDGKTRVLLNRGRDQWLGYASPSPDGRHLAFTEQTFESNSWLLENF